MFKAAKILLIALLSFALLAIGSIGAQALWDSMHHRYDQPNSGYYYGSVSAVFYGTDDEAYTFRFRGQSDQRWMWDYSTNLFYRSLHFEWRRFDTNAQLSEGRGTLTLPSLAYKTSQGPGVLTRTKLSEWLLGATNGTPEAMQGVDAIFGFIEDAGRGTLPGPNHHGHRFEQPVRGHIQHFSIGYGVGSFVYIWVGIWLLLVIFIGRRFWRRYGHA